jgi:hypothetical protein
MSPDRVIGLTEEHMKLIIAEGVKQGVTAALITLGVDLSDADSVQDWHDERAYVRKKYRSDEQRMIAMRNGFFAAALGGAATWLAAHFLGTPPTGH